MSKNTLYSLEELEKKSELALKDPKLVKIAKITPLNAKSKPNLTLVYNEAFLYALGQTNDLKKSKELARSTRFLAKIRRDYPEEFEKLITEKSVKPKTKEIEPAQEPEKEIPKPPEKKRFDEIEFEIPNHVELITTEGLQPGHAYGHFVPIKKRSIRFPKYPFLSQNHRYVGRFCLDILNKLIETESSEEKYLELDFLVEILEKKGLKIKVCGNCFYRGGDPISGGIYCREHPAHLSKSFDNNCEAWKAPVKN